MTCQTFEQSIVDYLERLLSPEERRAIDAHLQECPRCRAMLAEEHAIAEKLQQWPRVTCPERVVQRIFTEIERCKPCVSWRERVSAWSTAPSLWKIGVTAAALLAIVATAVFYREIGTPQYSPTEIAQARQEIELTLAYIHYYTTKIGDILEEQIASTQAAIRQPVETVLEDPLVTTQAAIRRPLQTTIQDTWNSLIGGML
jgi:hypothetical protein